MHRGRQHDATLRGALLVLAFLVARPLRAELTTSVFHAVDAATTVVVGDVGKLDKRSEKLVVFEIAVRESLKGAPQTSLLVAQEIVFRTDKPLLTEGASGVLLLDTFPKYSAYREALGTGAYFRIVEPRHALVDGAWRDALRAWIDLAKLPPQQQPTARAALLIGWLRRPDLGADAAQELASRPDLARGLDAANLTQLDAALRDDAVATSRRRNLVDALGAGKVTQAIPLLRGLTSNADLGAFARAALAKLGGDVPADAALADLHSVDPAQRIAALHTIGAKPANDKALDEVAKLARVERDDAVRVEAIQCLQAMGNEAVPALGQLLGDADRRFIYKASMALAEIATPQAISLLGKQFETGNYDAQVSAVFALHQIGTPDSLAILERVRANPPDPRLVKVIGWANNEDHSHD